MKNSDLVWAQVVALQSVIARKAPTLGHRIIAALEQNRTGPVAITQNIDGLEGRAGFEAVALHGRLSASSGSTRGTAASRCWC